MHGLTGGSWKRHTDRTTATEMKDTRGNLAVTSGSETYRRCALPRQLSTLPSLRDPPGDGWGKGVPSPVAKGEGHGSGEDPEGAAVKDSPA